MTTLLDDGAEKVAGGDGESDDDDGAAFEILAGHRVLSGIASELTDFLRE